MISPTTAEDVEPLDELERCDAAWGLHHVGRSDESRIELALMFDPRLLPAVGPKVELEEWLWHTLREFNGHLHGWGSFAFPTATWQQQLRLLHEHLQLSRSRDIDPRTGLITAIVDLPPEAKDGLHGMLNQHVAFVGSGDLSWPNDFRSIVYSEFSYN